MLILHPTPPPDLRQEIPLRGLRNSRICIWLLLLRSLGPLTLRRSSTCHGMQIRNSWCLRGCLSRIRTTISWPASNARAKSSFSSTSRRKRIPHLCPSRGSSRPVLAGVCTDSCHLGTRRPTLDIVKKRQYKEKTVLVTTRIAMIFKRNTK